MPGQWSPNGAPALWSQHRHYLTGRGHLDPGSRFHTHNVISRHCWASGQRTYKESRTTHIHAWVGDRCWKHWKWGSCTWKFLPHPTAVQQWQLGNWVEPWCWGGSLGWGLYCFHPGHVQAWGMPKRAKTSIRSPVGPTTATTKLKFIVNVTQVREMEKDSAKLKILPNRYPRQAKKDAQENI